MAIAMDDRKGAVQAPAKTKPAAAKKTAAAKAEKAATNGRRKN